MSSHHKINYVEFPARDFDRIKAFYQKAFNWQFTDYGADYIAFSGAGLDGGFFRSEHESLTVTGSALVVLYSEDLEGSEQTITEAGGAICQSIFSFPGGRRFHFKDPNGNELAVWSDVGQQKST